MKNKTTRFLVISILCVAVLCVFVFSFMTLRMSRRGSDAISDLGKFYMSGMSEQAATHFGTAIELRLAQVSALADAVPPSSSDDYQKLSVKLNNNARLRGFDHLAFCGKDGTLEMLYGYQMQVDDPESFRLSLAGGKEKMAHGKDSTGRDLVLMGIPAAYTMKSGETGIALVAALPITYIRDTLSLDADENTFYYFIIDNDGDMIIRGDDIEDTNYFDRVKESYSSVKGMTNDEYLTMLKKAMTDSSSISGEFTINGERRYLYGIGLPFSEWYLLVFMRYGQLDRTINSLENTWGWATVMSCILILVVLGVVFAVYFHITRKQMRELEAARLMAEQANKAKSEFLSNMSHDIRTPMNGIVGMTAIANANINDPQQVQNCLKKIELSSRHLLGLINDILDMSKIERGKLELHVDKMSLQEIMQSVSNIMLPQAGAKKQSFDFYVYDVFSESVYCDSVRLSQIMLNLLGNAVKFTQEGGSVSVKVCEEKSPKGDDFVRVRLFVKDNGIGMTDEFQKKIFDAFSREDNGRVQKTEGSGLGMAITKYIVDAMEGEISVQSKLNEGTEFCVTLDLKKAEQETFELPGWNVLVVSHKEQLRKCVAQALDSMGCKASVASDLATAVEEAKAQGEALRAVLIDEKLPSGACVQVAEQIKALNKDVAIALLASTASSELSDEDVAAGITGAISKPLFRSNLFRGLKHVCENASDSPAALQKEKIDFSGKRVLLAEDNELNREIAQELLGELDLKIDEAEDGKICADMFEKSPVGWYDAILMDIRMPVMNGYESTKAIRAMSRPDAKTVPIIAMSADAFAEDVQRCLDCGMNAHTAKPIDMDVVADILNKFIGDRS